MKILEDEMIKLNELKNGHIYLVKFQGISLAIFKDGEFYINHRNNLKKINFKDAMPFYEYSKPVENFLDIIPEFLKIEQIKKNIVDKRVKYSAGFLDNYYQNIILEKFIQQKPENWEIVCHHMTICLGKMFDNSYLGKTEKAIVTHIGKSEELGIMALKVETDIPSKNEIKHITLFKKSEVDSASSNLIEHWNEIVPFEIYLNIGECLNNKNIKLYQDVHTISNHKKQKI